MIWFRSATLILLISWVSQASSDPAGGPPNHSSIEEMNTDRWIRVTSRVEIASTELAVAARSLSTTANEIETTGRLSRLTQLSGHASTLNQRVIQARMASDEMLRP